MTDEFDPFKGGIGLKDDFVGTVTKAWFIKDSQARNYSLQLHILAEDAEEIEPRYGLGGDWATYDGGESVEHPKGAATYFNNQTAYYNLIAKAMACGGEEEMRQRNKNLENRGPQFASLWVGLKFHWRIEDAAIRVPDPEGGWKDSTIPRLLPDKFVGVYYEPDLWAEKGAQKAETSGAPPDTTASPAPTPAPSTPAAGGSPTDSLTAEDSAKLKVLAKTNSFPDFVDAVMALTDSTGTPMIENKEIMAALSQESFYNEMKG